MYKTTLRNLALCVPLALVSASAFADLPDFAQLVEKNAPAVVNVQATHNGDSTVQGEVDDQEVPEIFRRFFGPGNPGVPGGHPRVDGTRISLGSGFVISGDGYILTNNHVVEGADQVVVRLSDRRELDAKVIGTDPESDIALLKVTATALPTVAIGDSNKLKPGQWVVAIGSPFNFSNSVTAGIVSALGREVRGGSAYNYVNFIQTDVAVNPGNSGGPLFNMNGEVVGINSQIYSNTGSSVGISFAIPIDIAMNTVDQLKASGHVSRGMIGVQIQNVDRAMAQGLSLPRSGGALVNKLTPGSGADKADVHVGDVILAYNGRDIEQSTDLPPMVGNSKPGSKAELKIFRDGKTMTVPVVVGELPHDKATVASLGGGGDKSSNPLGIIVEDLSAEQRKQLGLKDQGVVISDIKSAAARRTALQPGDVVLMVGRKPVKTAVEFDTALKEAKPGDSVMLLVRRDDATQFVAVPVPKGKEKG